MREIANRPGGSEREDLAQVQGILAELSRRCPETAAWVNALGPIDGGDKETAG